jgi:hypothetical protein
LAVWTAIDVIAWNVRVASHDQSGVQAIQTELPRVGVGSGGAGVGLHLGIQTPGHVRALQPALQRVAAAVVDAEAARHGGHVEKVHHLADGEAAFSQIERLGQRAHQRMRARQPDVCQMPGNVLGIAAVLRLLTEHGGQIRRIRADVRRHHHDVAMLQGRGVSQRAQQAVFQHLQFAQPGVAGVHAQAGIVAQRRQHVSDAFAVFHCLANRFADQLRLQAADAGLQLRQQRGFTGQRLGLIEQVAFVDRVAVVQGQAEVLRDAAQRHQQRMADLEIQRGWIVLPFQQKALPPQVDPMLAARVGKIQMHRPLHGAGLERRQHVRRQVADAEYVQRRVVAAALGMQRVEQHAAALRAVRSADGLLHLPPQHCLPVARVPGGMLLPVQDPVRPVSEVLGVQAGQIFGQLKTAPRAVLAVQVGGDVGRAQRWQRHQQAPAQHLAAIRAADQRLVAQCAAGHAFEPLPRQDHLDIGRDAVATVRAGPVRKTAQKPAFQAGVRHHDGLRGQRIGRPLGFESCRQRIGQPLGAAAAVDDQAACVRIHP